MKETPTDRVAKFPAGVPGEDLYIGVKIMFPYTLFARNGAIVVALIAGVLLVAGFSFGCHGATPCTHQAAVTSSAAHGPAQAASGLVLG